MYDSIRCDRHVGEPYPVRCDDCARAEAEARPDIRNSSARCRLIPAKFTRDGYCLFCGIPADRHPREAAHATA